ncbi:MAG: hypothetical protein J1F63_09600 [Oscillospiraceae bacterium]|nr:hypothetical protein [Oscillospiraceae bacterium]
MPMKNRSKRIIAVTALLSILLCFVQQAVSADIPYEDSESGVSFILPGNWEEAQFRNYDPVYMDVKYINRDSGDMIIFGATDVWLDEFKDEGISRSDLNNDIYTVDEWADTVCGEDCERYEVTINGIKYYVIEFYTETDGILLTNIQYSYINNAVIYQFYYASLELDNIDDFESMIYSAEYPDTTVDVESFAGAASSKDHTRQESESPFMRILTAGLAGAISGPLLASIYILKNKLFGNAKVENSAEPDGDTTTPEPAPGRDAVMRSKKRKFVIKRYSKDDPDVPMIFYKIYICVRLPLIVMIYIKNLYTNNVGTGISSVVPFLESVAAVCIIIGLAKKEYWGYVVNKFFLIIEVIFSVKIIITGLYYLHYGEYEIFSYSVSFGIAAIITNSLIFVYFEKRKYLFDGAPPENNEPHQMTFSDYHE